MDKKALIFNNGMLELWRWEAEFNTPRPLLWQYSESLAAIYGLQRRTTSGIVGFDQLFLASGREKKWDSIVDSAESLFIHLSLRRY